MARFILTLLIVGLILASLGGLGEVSRVMAKFAPLYIGLIIAVITLDRALMTFKWLKLLASQGIHVPFLRGMKIYCASMIWGLFLPMTVGADAVRAFTSSRCGIDGTCVVASIVIERTIGFLAALVIGLVGFLLLFVTGTLDPRFNFVWWPGAAMLVVAALLLAASMSQWAFNLIHDRLLHRAREWRVIERLREFHASYRTYQRKKGVLAVFFVLSLVEQIVTILYVWLVARGMEIDVSLQYVAGAVPLAMLVARIPVTVHGLGVFDGVFAILMSRAGLALPEAIAITLAVRILEIASWSPWWLADVVARRTVRPHPMSAVGS